MVQARLKRALVALRERLVAIYETGTPDVLSVILGSNGYDDLADRTEYLDRIHGMDEAVVGRVRELRDQVKRTVARLRTAKDRIESARDAIAAEEQALAERPRAPCSSASRRWSPTRAERRRGAGEDRKHRRRARRRRRRDPGQDRRDSSPATGSAPLPAGPIQAGNGSGLIWPVDGPVVSGFGPRTINGSYEFHPGIDIAVPEGTPIRAAAAGTVIFTEPEAEQRRLRQLHLHRPRRRALHLLRPPGVLRGQRRAARLPGPDDRLQRLHRLLLRPPRPFRGADQRRSHRPDGLPLAAVARRRPGNPNIGYAGGVRPGTLGTEPHRQADR